MISVLKAKSGKTGKRWRTISKSMSENTKKKRAVLSK